MAKINKTTAILGGVGILGIIGAVIAAIFGGKKTKEPELIEGEFEELPNDETYSDGE